jgi:hypothetical protein
MNSRFDGGDHLPMQDDDDHRFVVENHAVVPATIKQVMSALQSTTPGDGILIDERPRKQVSLVGLIKSVKADNLYFVYNVDDGTGNLFAQDFRPNEKEGEPVPAMTYAHVVGRMVAGDSYQISAFCVKPIVDCNQIPYHFLSALYIHLLTTRGRAANSALVPSPVAEAHPGPRAAEDVPIAVLALLRRRNKDKGMPKREIIGALSHKYAIEDIDQAIHTLACSSEIYPGEDDHWIAVP